MSTPAEKAKRRKRFTGSEKAKQRKALVAKRRNRRQD